MKRAVGLLTCAVLLAAHCASAHAATNGMLAAIANGRLVTFDQDGTGVRAVWTPPSGDELTEPVFSPDGNQIALVDSDDTHGARIVVVTIATGAAQLVTDHAAGSNDEHPGWTADGSRVLFLRSPALLPSGFTGQRAASVAPDGAGLLLLPFGVTAPVDDASWAPNGALAFSASGVLAEVGTDLSATRILPGTPKSGLAWSPGSDAIAYQDAAGGNLKVLRIAGGTSDVTSTDDDTDPAWSPDGTALVYDNQDEVRTVPVSGGTPVSVLRGAEMPTWQPCVAGVTVACTSAAFFPTCQPSSLTTQAGAAVAVPAPPCVDRAGRPVTMVVVKAPQHGTFANGIYTPAAGFTGEDALLYRGSDGVSQSAITTLTLFVVPKPVVVAAQPTPPSRAPYLSAPKKPKLSRSGHALLRASCDQDCVIELRLLVRAKGKTVEGPVVTKAGRAFAFNLKVRKVKHIKTVWITGTVRNTAGQSRSVRLPVAR